MELRTMLDWEIAPRLREVSGVTEINTMGGFYKTFEVRPDPDLLDSQDVTLDELYQRIEASNENAGGGYVLHNDEQRFIRGQALLKSVDDIRNVVVRRSRIRLAPAGLEMLQKSLSPQWHAKGRSAAMAAEKRSPAW